METSGTGTRVELPASFPASWGSTCVMAFVAWVVVGTMLRAAARPRRRSRAGAGASISDCPAVYACTVPMSVQRILKALSSTESTGATACVVQLAAESTCAPGGISASLTPVTIMASASPGAPRMTRGASLR